MTGTGLAELVKSTGLLMRTGQSDTFLHHWQRDSARHVGTPITSVRL